MEFGPDNVNLVVAYLENATENATENGTIHDGFREVFSERYNPILIKSCLVLLARIGFILIQESCIPVQNIYVILHKNILSIGTAIITYLFFGFFFSFSQNSLAGIMGYGGMIKIQGMVLTDAVVGMLSTILGTGIICSALCGRMHFLGLIIIIMLYSGFFQPLVMHWIWNDLGVFFQIRSGIAIATVKDHGGLLVIHLTASVVAFIGIYCLGRRVLILRTIDPLSIGLDSTSRVTMGYFFLMLGFMAFELPTAKYETRHLKIDEIIGLMVMNNLIAISVSFITVTIHHVIIYRKQIFTYWIYIRTLQGGFSGVVALAAAPDQFSPQVVVMLSILSSTVFFWVAFPLHTRALEDPLNVFAIHFCAGLMGNLFTALFGTSASHDYYVNFFFNQLLAHLVITLTFAIFFILIFYLLSLTRILSARTERTNHAMAQHIKNKQKKKCFSRLFDMSKKRYYIEPTTILYMMKSEDRDLKIIKPTILGKAK